MTRARTVGPELGDVLFVQGDHANMDTIGPVFIATVHHVHYVVFADCHVHRVAKTGPGELVASYGMAIREGSIF